MNNLNEPRQNWNILPNYRDGEGGGSKWNYALLVPMLALAAFRWIWSRESQKEIEEVRAACKKSIDTTERDLKLKYEDIIVQNRRSLARCELEQEKLKSKVQSYREALLAQSHRLVEERRQLEQERKNIEEKKRSLQHSGVAGALYQDLLEKEGQWETQARALIKDYEKSLVDRQNLFCSYFIPRQERLELERKMLSRAVANPIAKELGIETGLKYIFDHETHCANLQNTDKTKNGKLLWVYLEYWELRAELQKFKKVGKALLEK
ncbi:coiled-coil domain-containing protein 127-like [Pristis pectinata]|uniref:coiled-coil domain-containing protein 127-like n=1 Tax=Pristis pectinata TaxID=685728 RepID=UPI00223DC2E8|nr:coiled-coil domain-containing protein 127-like [Pristis pectinata]XP_051879106.1 coiled-coil domain-containing protein 127-like [Pristis pectinata]XP_051879107.1 coiled-coil domain-containing protein 127-like [Pristis pectinata]XP_051879108.1 coiled-coil domain-containing protein 127-like [Pristis pectinata]XP_051879109.1 coiled-coil domain-containing protein 127-like [Pristis pectinata]XP_051879110.1 coiled-coil domain-containing protein 127-like [Pristis pectinata]